VRRTEALSLVPGAYDTGGDEPGDRQSSDSQPGDRIQGEEPGDRRQGDEVGDRRQGDELGDLEQGDEPGGLARGDEAGGQVPDDDAGVPVSSDEVGDLVPDADADADAHADADADADAHADADADAHAHADADAHAGALGAGDGAGNLGSDDEGDEELEEFEERGWGLARWTTDRRRDLLAYIAVPVVTLFAAPMLVIFWGIVILGSGNGAPSMCDEVRAVNGCEELTWSLIRAHVLGFLGLWALLWALPWWRGLRQPRVMLALASGAVLFVALLRMAA
jgi:hypothetical protein